MLVGVALALVVVAALVSLGSRVLVPLLVVALFVNHFRFEVAGLHFLAEHFVVVALLLALVREGKSSKLFEVATDRTALLLGAFVIWEGLVSLVQSPVPSDSLPIVGWLGLDWLILIAAAASLCDTERFERLATLSATGLAAVAVVLGIAHGFGSDLGTNGNYANGARAVYALSFEPNILASTVAIWAFVAISSPHRRIRRIAQFCLPLALGAIAFSFTRAVIMGLALGLVVWAVISGRAAAKQVAKIAALAACLAALTAVLAPAFARPIEDRAQNLLQLDTGTGASRVDKVKQAADDLHGANLIVGLGVDSFGQRHDEPTIPGSPAFLGVLPVQVVYEGGLVAASLLILAVASLRPLARPGRARALGALVIYAVAATGTSPFWFGSTWLLIALAMLTRPSESTGQPGLPNTEP